MDCQRGCGVAISMLSSGKGIQQHRLTTIILCALVILSYDLITITADIVLVGFLASLALCTFRMQRSTQHQKVSRKSIVHVTNDHTCSGKGVFKSIGFDQQIQELLSQITLKPDDEKAVNDLVKSLQPIIAKHISPEARVFGAAHANPFTCIPQSTIEPEIRIVIGLDVERYSAVQLGRLSPEDSDAAKVSAPKNILRRINRHLPQYGFKFRHCSFVDPVRACFKVPPSCTKVYKQASAQITVNDTVTIHHARLMTCLKESEPLTFDVMLVVQQWARWRSLCSSECGHLSLYAWSILALFYLQVKGVTRRPAVASCNNQCGGQDSSGALFKGFFRFFNREFDLGTKVVSLSTGMESLPQQEPNQSMVSLRIQDPFDASQDLGRHVTAHGLETIKQEFLRGDKMCSGGRSLTELFTCRDII